jgi:hypothetical protein
VRIEDQRRFFVALDQTEIRIGTFQLIGEFLADRRRRSAGKPAFSGAKSHERKLVVFTGFQLKRAPVCPVRNDGIAEVGQRNRFPQASRIARREVNHDLLDQTFQIGHRAVLDSLLPRWKGLPLYTMRTLVDERRCSGFSVLLGSSLLLGLLFGRAAAQEDCFPSKDSHEAQLFAALAVPLAFSLAESPEPALAAGGVRVGVEATYLT